VFPALSLGTLGDRIARLVEDLSAGAVNFAGDLVAFLAAVVVFYVLGRVAVLPVVSRLLERHGVEGIEMPYPYRELAGGVDVTMQDGEAGADDD